jgi:hypothetical protein
MRSGTGGEAGHACAGAALRHDRICPQERLETIGVCFRAEIHRVPEDQEYNEVSPRIPRTAHSVLTAAFVDRPDHPTSIASSRVVAFLSEHLQLGSRNGDSNAITST